MIAPLLTLLAMSMPVDSVTAREARPYGVGEDLHFEVRAPLVGRVGAGRMTIEASEVIRGHTVLRIRSEVSARALFVSVHDRHTTWYDPQAERSVRFHQDERGTLKPTVSRDYDFFPAERRWERTDLRGETGPLTSTAPLDELSYLYYVRGLPLKNGDQYQLERHFEPEKNPVSVSVEGRETVRVPAGTFEAIKVVVRVPMSNLFGRGPGTLVMYLSDDERRLPVLVTTAIPVAGSVRLELSSHAHGPAR